MTAREIINKASTLPPTASMYQIIESRQMLRGIENTITGEQIVNDWRDAMCHLDILDEEMAENIKAGQPVRIL